jgi:hypothetical protein
MNFVADFDADLIHALETCYRAATAADRSMIGWVLEKIDGRQ